MPPVSRDMPEPELGETIPKVCRAWERGGGEGVKERHRRGSARTDRDPVSLLHPSGPHPAPPHAPRRVSPHAPRGVSEQPVSTVVPRSQPVGRPLAARAQIEGRARRGARMWHEGRGTRREARGARDEGPLRRRARYVRGGRVVTARCRTLDAWRACLTDGRSPTRPLVVAQNSELLDVTRKQAVDCDASQCDEMRKKTQP